MDAFKGWLDTVSTSLTQKPPEETPSVLAEWNSYVKKSHGSDDGAEDLESATVATTSGMSSTTIPFLRFDTISSHLRDAPTSFLGAMSRMQSGVQSGMQGAAATATAGVQSLPSRQKLIYFGFFNLAGFIFLALSFTFIPVLVLSPQKFALFFTFGNISIMGSFFALKGPRVHLAHMLARERRPFSAGYIASMAGTLYGALVARSYPLTIVCSALQVLALLYYSMSYFPGGAIGAKVVFNMAVSSFKNFVALLQRTVPILFR